MKYKVKVIAGFGVASGNNNDPRYPDGTLAMQRPYFQKEGLDLSPYFQGTLNVDISPKSYQIINPKYFFKHIAWSPYIPPENFYFFDVTLFLKNQAYEGLIYLPDPVTKNDHFQAASTLELILPKIDGNCHGQEVTISTNKEQLIIC